MRLTGLFYESCSGSACAAKSVTVVIRGMDIALDAIPPGKYSAGEFGVIGHGSRADGIPTVTE